MSCLVPERDDPAAAYRQPDAEVLIFDAHTTVMAEELRAFLAGWLGLAPEDYQSADLQTAAAVLVDRLGLRRGGDRYYDQVVAHLLGLS